MKNIDLENLNTSLSQKIEEWIPGYKKNIGLI